MDNDERLERHLDLCRRIYKRMKRDRTWPWADSSKGAAPAVKRVAPGRHRGSSPSIPKMSEPKKCASLESDPVLLFDNSSSDPHPIIELMSVAEAAVFLSVSKSGVRRLQQGRHLAFIKVGGSVRFVRGDLIAYLVQRRVKALDS